MRKIAAHRVLTPGGWLTRAVVAVDDDGRIRSIDTPEDLDRQAGVEFYNGVLVPAFWNAHCHLELSHLRGVIAQGTGFVGFARGMREARRRVDGGEMVACDKAMWEAGVGRVSDVSNGSGSFPVKRASAMEYHTFCELFGLGADVRRAAELCRQAQASGLGASVTPHSTYSLGREAFSAAAKTGPLSIHFLESEAETELFRKRGPLWDWYVEQGMALDFLEYGSPAERLVGQVARDVEVMLVHNCRLTQRDIDIVMEHFSAPVTWVICPRSNSYISHLEPPVELLRNNGLRIAVGTDSLASNEELSIVGELSTISGVPLDEMLGWVSTDAIEVGRAPGLVLVEGVDFEKMALTASAKSHRIL